MTDSPVRVNWWGSACIAVEMLRERPDVVHDVLLSTAPEDAIHGTTAVDHLWIRPDRCYPEHGLICVDLRGSALRHRTTNA